MEIELHGKQSEAFQSEATELLYGGAAGGGKSHLLRVAGIAWCVDVPGLQVYLFRRTHPDLQKNHFVGPTSFPVLLAEWIAQGFVKINDTKGQILFANGSTIHACHCQHEKDVYSFQGAEIHVLMIDELTHFSAAQYRYLRSRVRLGAMKVPKRWQGHFPRVVGATNPGGVGHNWVKSEFIDPQPPFRIWRTDKSEGNMLRQFIPAVLADNPTMTENDPDYADKLSALGDPALVKAMLEGRWDIVAGGMFDDLWRPDVHVIEPFPIPPQWYVVRTHDYGDSKPFCTLITAESNGEEIEMRDGTVRSFPRGSVIVIGEDYGWNGKPNEGLRLTSTEIARRVVELEESLRSAGILSRGHKVQPGPGDIPDLADGRSPRQEYARIGAQFTAPQKGPGSREAGWLTVRQCLKAATGDPATEPGVYFFDTCPHIIRTLPVAPRDERKRSDVDTDCEDHALDTLRYRLSGHIARPRTAKISYV